MASSPPGSASLTALTSAPSTATVATAPSGAPRPAVGPPPPPSAAAPPAPPLARRVGALVGPVASALTVEAHVLPLRAPASTAAAITAATVTTTAALLPGPSELYLDLFTLIVVPVHFAHRLLGSLIGLKGLEFMKDASKHLPKKQTSSSR